MLRYPLPLTVMESLNLASCRMLRDEAEAWALCSRTAAMARWAAGVPAPWGTRDANAYFIVHIRRFGHPPDQLRCPLVRSGAPSFRQRLPTSTAQLSHTNLRWRTTILPSSATVPAE